MRAAVARHNRSVRDQGVVDTRERHQVGLELGQVDVQGTIKAETGSDRANDLGNQTVQVLKAGTRDVQVATADVVDSLVVHQEGAIGVLNGAVGGQNGVIGLDHSSRHTRSRVDRELELRLLAILGGEALQQQGTETRTSTTTERMEDQETLEGATVVWKRNKSVWFGVDYLYVETPTSNATNTVNDIVDQFLSNRVVTTGICQRN